MLQVCLTREPSGFPKCGAGSDAIKRTIPATSTNIRFTGLPAGTYAVAIIHDANANKKLDTFAGIPREGFGFSRNPKIGFGPPSFRSASFDAGAAPVQQVRIRYLL